MSRIVRVISIRLPSVENRPLLKRRQLGWQPGTPAVLPFFPEKWQRRSLPKVGHQHPVGNSLTFRGEVR